MRTEQVLLCLLVSLTTSSGCRAGAPLWNGIEAGTLPEALESRLFQDARLTFHGFTPHFLMTGFYIQPNDPVTIRIVFDHEPKQVCGVNIEGEQSTLEREALLADLGPPTARVAKELPVSPKGSAALNGEGRFSRIWTWQKRSTLVTFEDRARPGYFLTVYRWIEDGKAHAC